MVEAVRMVRDSTLATMLMDELVCSPLDITQWMERSTRVLKGTVNSLVGTLDVGGTHCFLKLYRDKSGVHKFQHTLGRGRPLRSFRAARVLHKAGVPVPESFGCLRVSEGMLLLTEGIVCEGNFMEAWDQGLPESAARRLLQAAGQAIAQLHLSGYAHGDCKWSNLLWDGNGITFVDLDDVARARVHSGKQSRDLARFTLNAEELAIGPPLYDFFLENYLQLVDESRREAVERMGPFLYSLRAKHLSRYGPRGQRLI